MFNSTDTAELKYYWRAWHNHTSFGVKNVYLKYIGMLNHMAKLNSNLTNDILIKLYEKKNLTAGVSVVWSPSQRFRLLITMNVITINYLTADPFSTTVLDNHRIYFKYSLLLYTWFQHMFRYLWSTLNLTYG